MGNFFTINFTKKTDFIKSYIFGEHNIKLLKLEIGCTSDRNVEKLKIDPS